MVTTKQLDEHVKALVAAASAEGGTEFEEDELLQLVIDFANEGKPSGPLMRLAQREPYLDLRAMQKQLRKDLGATVDGSLRRSDLQRWIDAARRMVAIPERTIEQLERRRPPTITWRYYTLELAALISHVVLLVVGDEMGFGTRLKRCKFQSCEAPFFLLPAESSASGGRPRESYCSKEHMDEAHRGTGAERTRRWRERKASGQKRVKRG